MRKFYSGIFMVLVMISIVAISVCLQAEGKPAICDVTNAEVNVGEGYLATTTEVLTSKAYWRYIEKSQKALISISGNGDVNTFLKEYATQMNTIGGKTPWLLSDEAAKILGLNDGKHKAWAKQWWQSNRTFLPPGNGQAILNDVYVSIKNRNK